MESIKTQIKTDWRSSKALSALVGQNCENSFEFCWGGVPTEKAKVTSDGEKIIRIETWSGLNWSAKSGRGTPFSDTEKV